MRSGGALVIAAVTLLASSARARADRREDPLASEPRVAPVPPDPLAVLREPGRGWVFKRVFGKSLTSLVEPGQEVLWLCEVKPWTAPGPLVRSSLVCDRHPKALDGPESGSEWTIWLVFDDVGVRQLDEETTNAGDRTRTRGITFPRKLEGTWKLDEKGRAGGRTLVSVREDTARVRGVARKVWVAEVQRWDPPVGGKVADPAEYHVQFIPDVGPVLMCQGRPGPGYECLQLVEAKPPPPPPPPDASKPPAPPPPPPPPGRVTIASKVAHDPSTLKAADVGAKIASAYLGGVRRCYLAVLAKQPRARGELSLVFTVNAVGKTTMITVKGFDDGVASCVAKLVNDWRFPIPQSTYAEPRNARFTIGLGFAP